MLNQNTINYKLSLQILDNLKKLNLITDKEYNDIDKKNKESFKYMNYEELS